MKWSRRLTVVFFAPWLLLSINLPGIQHRVDALVLLMNGLVAAGITWLWFLLPFPRLRASIVGVALILFSLFVWNVPGFAFLPPALGPFEPLLVMLAVGLLYRTGVAMIEPLRDWMGETRSKPIGKPKGT